MVVTADDVLTRFSNAVAIARRLPHAGPHGFHNVWPEIQRFCAAGDEGDSKRKRCATAAEIAEYETVASWMGFVEDAAVRRMIWAYSAGMAGWQIAKAMKPTMSQSTVHRRILRALIQIADKLNAGEKPPVIRYEENYLVP